LLQDHEVKYLLIGGYAVSYHGYVRATGDMDIWIERENENAKKLMNVLQNFGFKTENISPNLFMKPENVIRMGVPPIRIELMNSISGVEFSECYDNRVEETWNGVKVNIISLDKLRDNKKASGRLKDLSDLEHLQE
jgi:hypothetical protein